MADPTTNDYTTKTKAELHDLLVERDRTLVQAAQRVQRLEQDVRGHAQIIAERDTIIGRYEDDLVKKAKEHAVPEVKAEVVPREKRGVAKHLGKIDVFDIDTHEDVIERAMAVRAGRIPAAMARRFKTDARLRAPAGTGLARRLSKRDDAPAEVPIGTEFDREEAKDGKGVDLLDVNDLYAAGALIAVA